ncbi:hypothetical protein ACT453_50275 [Bacillus sp. D-CC]
MKRDPLFLTLLESAHTHFSGWDHRVGILCGYKRRQLFNEKIN